MMRAVRKKSWQKPFTRYGDPGEPKHKSGDYRSAPTNYGCN